MLTPAASASGGQVSEWGDFLERCRKEPRKAFSLVADSQIVALVYRLLWGADDPSTATS